MNEFTLFTNALERVEQMHEGTLFFLSSCLYFLGQLAAISILLTMAIGISKFGTEAVNVLCSFVRSDHRSSTMSIDAAAHLVRNISTLLGVFSCRRKQDNAVLILILLLSPSPGWLLGLLTFPLVLWALAVLCLLRTLFSTAGIGREPVSDTPLTLPPKRRV